MKLWLILSISAYLFYAVSSSIDKHLMNEKVNALSTNTIKMILDGAVILSLGLIFLDLSLSVNALVYAGILGVIYGASGILYFRALQEMDVNRVIPSLHSLRLSLIFLFSIVLLRETASVYNLAGVLGISAGVFLVLSRGNSWLPQADKGIKLIAANLVLAVVHGLLTKIFVSGVNPETLSTVMYFSAGISLLLYQTWSGKIRELKPVARSHSLPKIGLAAFFAGTATLMLFKALELAEASQVYPVSGTQSVFILAISSIFLGEKPGWKRGTGILIVAAGVYLVQL